MIKNIAIRVDADEKIGLGHLHRIKGFIFRNIKKYKEFIVITKSNKSLISRNFYHKKIKVFFLKKDNSQSILNILKKKNCKTLFSDISYSENIKKKNFFKNYHNFLSINNILSVSIDDPSQYICSDLSFLPYPLNNKDVKKYKKTKLFSGIKFICFNKDIIVKKKIIKKIPKNLLVALSGNSKKRITIRILKSILKTNQSLKIKVINDNLSNEIGDGFGNEKSITYLNNMHNINNLLDWSDIAIVGEGLLRFEASVKGIPNIFINNIENNKFNMKLIKDYLSYKSSIFFNCQNFDQSKFIEKFQELFTNYQLKKNLSKNGLKHFDTKGHKRISKEIEKIYFSNFS